MGETAPSGKPKILFVASNFPPVRGGSASVYANLARCLPGRLVVLAPTRDYVDGLPLIGWREHDRAAPYRIIRIPLLRTILQVPIRFAQRATWRSWDLWIRLRVLACILRAIVSDRVRVVCVGELLASGWILRVCKALPGIRVLAYVHGEEITTDTGHDPAHGKARRYLLHSDRIVVVSRFTLSVTTALIGPSYDGTISLIQNGVDSARFRPGPKPPELAAALGLEGRFVFVSVCRLVEKKGLDNAIAALPAVLEQYPDCRLLIVGAGPYQPTLAALVERLGLAQHVQFAGSVPEDELLSHYHLGDVFIMPNRALPDGDTEGFGLVFLEANACGLPVIAGQDGGSLEAVEDGYNGLVVDGHDILAISAAMLRLRASPELRTRLKQNGQHRATTNDWTAKATQFLTACGLD